MSATGSVLWSFQIGGALNDEARGVAVDPQTGAVYVAGFFGHSGDLDQLQQGASAAAPTNASATFGAGAAAATLRSLGSQAAPANAPPPVADGDGFLAKISPAGTLLWTQQFGGASNDRALSVSVDAATGAAYVGGWVYGAVATFGNATRQTVIHLQGMYSATGFVRENALLAKFGPDGTVQWAQGSSGDALDVIYSVAASPGPAGGVFAAGAFTSRSVTFGSSAALLGSPGSLIDAFLLKASTCRSQHTRAPVHACMDLLCHSSHPHLTTC